MRTFEFYLAVIFSVITTASYSQQTERFTVSGYVKEQGSGELLMGVSVVAPHHNAGSQTNNYGFYSLTLPAGDSVTLVFSMFGYRSERRILQLRQDTELNISLSADTATMEEVTIVAEEYKKVSEGAEISTIDIPVKQVKDIPALLGEKDVLKVIQLMPGVKKGGEVSSGLYVRGGGPDQNLIILDDAVIYNAYHLFGFFSIFNGDAIKSVSLIKGGFPAQYGGRLASVIEMNMKEGNKEKVHGEAGIGLLSSRLTVEGPLKKGKSSFLVSGRRTYLDVLTYPFQPSKEKAGYNFHDLNAKVNYDFGQKNKLYLSGYYGRDIFYLRFKDDDGKYRAGLGWNNATATLRWNHLFSSKLFANASLIFSNYRLKVFEGYDFDGNSFDLKYQSGIRDFTFKYDLDYLPGPAHSVKIGMLSTYHTFTPGAKVMKDTYIGQSENIGNRINGLESAVYISDVYKPFSRLTVNAGLRGNHFVTQGKSYFRAEPRLSVGYKIRQDLAVKAGYSIMNQYMFLLSNSGIGLPTDLWVPATRNLRPQQSQQIAGGIAKDLPGIKNTTLTVEGYYKSMNHMVAFKEGASFIVLSDPARAGGGWENKVTSGKGWSYGMEFLLQKKSGKFSGWIGYTLSWTQLQFDSLNGGKKYYARYDRRHDVSLVGIYKANERITLSATWVYGTGNAITLPGASYEAPVHNPTAGANPVLSYYPTISEYGTKNGSRMPAYHRLDVGIQFHKELKWGGRRTWEVSVYNVYNRKNPFFYYMDQKSVRGGYKYVLKQVALFPFIPSVSYQIRF